MSRMLCAVAAVVLAMAQVGQGDVFDLPPTTLTATPPVAAPTMPGAMTTPQALAAPGALTPPGSPPGVPPAAPAQPLAPSTRSPLFVAQASTMSDDPSSLPAPSQSTYSDLAPIVGDGYSDRPVIPASARSQGGGWIGGASVMVLKPHWSGGNSGLVIRGLTTTGSSVYETNDFSYGFQASPAAWFGYLNAAGNGIRVNFFQYQQGATISGPVSANQIMIDAFAFGNTLGIFSLTPGTQMSVMSALQLSYFDLEALKRVNTLNWQWTASAGVRYAYLNQKYESSLSPVSSSVTTVGSLAERHYFNGAGPTLAFHGRRPIGDSPLGIFGSARASLLFGSDSQSISESLTTGLSTTYNRSSWGVLPQGELEFGADFRRPIGDTTFIIENALTAQAWFNAGTSSGTTAFGADMNQATLGFYGWRGSIGLTY